MTEAMGARRRRRSVGDAEYKRAYYGDPADEKSMKAAADNRGIIRGILAQYQKQLSEEELEQCGMDAMWRCLQYHDETYGQKFTTSLHRFTRWECNRALGKQKGFARKSGLKQVPLGDVAESHGRGRHDGSFREDADQNAEDMGHVLECMEVLDDEERQVIRQYYFDHLTMEQIGEANGYSKETARQKILRSVRTLKQVCLESLGESAGVLPG